MKSGRAHGRLAQCYLELGDVRLCLKASGEHLESAKEHNDEHGQAVGESGIEIRVARGHEPFRRAVPCITSLVLWHKYKESCALTIPRHPASCVAGAALFASGQVIIACSTRAVVLQLTLALCHDSPISRCPSMSSTIPLQTKWR